MHPQHDMPTKVMAVAGSEFLVPAAALDGWSAAPLGNLVAPV